MIKKIIAWFHYGLEDDDYKEAKIRIRTYNLNKLKKFSAIIGVIFMCLFFSSYIRTGSSGMHILRESAREYYLYVGVLAIFVYILSSTFLTHYKYFVLGTWYILMFALFYFAIWIAIHVQLGHPAVAFCVFITTLPSLFIDRSFRIIPLMCIASLGYLYLSYTSKITTIFLYDFGNIMTFLTLGIFMTLNNRHIQIRAITNELMLEKQRDIDSLSTLNNRKAFERIVRNLNKNSSGTLIILDIDDFKSFNDNYGHIYGDGVIREVGMSIREIFNENAITGRYGGDEFLIYLVNTTDRELIQSKFTKLNQRVNKDENMNIRQINLSAGAAVYPDEGRKYSEIFYLADERLLNVKRHGKGIINFED